MTSKVKTPFKDLCDLCTKIILSHSGSHLVLTSTKIRVMSAVVGELQGIRYNWAEFIIKQWKETADFVKKVEGVDDIF